MRYEATSVRAEAPLICGKRALKSRRAGMPIGPLAYGSCSCTCALRNLHKKPGHAGSARCAGDGRSGCERAVAVAGIRAAVAARPRVLEPSFVRLCTGRKRLRPAGSHKLRPRPTESACELSLGGYLLSAAMRAFARITAGGKHLPPVEERQSRVDEQLCSSTLLPMVRPPASSPYETSANCRGAAGWRRAASAASIRVAFASNLRRLVQVSCGWPRVAAGSDLWAPAGSRATSGRGVVLGRRPPAAARARSRAATRASCCTFFAVCCAFVRERAISCTFFSVCCGGGRARGALPPAFPSKTAGQTNDAENAYRK